MTTAGLSIRRQRAHGIVSLSVERMGAASGVRRLAEAGSARLRLPNVTGGVPEGVLINTAGGVVGGDLFETDAAVGPDAGLVLTTSAAEKVYKAEGASSEVRTHARVEAGGRFEWLPQETILFNRARLRRTLDVDLAGSATVLLFEAVVFGRAAFDEIVREGAYTEHWRVCRGGRLVYADSLRLHGPIHDILARPTMAGGCRALATLVFVSPEAEGRLEQVRALLDGATSECGASAWNGLLAVRWLAPDIGTLRRDVARFMNPFRGRPLPRVWHL